MKRFSLALGIPSVAILCIFGLLRSASADLPSEYLRFGLFVSGAGSAVSLLAYVSVLLGRLRGGERSRGLFGLLLLHVGLFAMLLGFGVDEAFGVKGSVWVREETSANVWFDEGGEEHELPFALYCVDFRLSVYPGTLRVSDYRSEMELVSEAGRRKPFTLRVNAPFVHEGWRFYQEDYGVEPGGNARIDFVVRTDRWEERVTLRPGERRTLDGSGVSVRLLDFSPTLVERDGKLVTLRDDALLHPASLLEVETPEGGRTLAWLTASAPESRALDGVRIDPVAYRGMEYTKLSVIRSPGRDLVLAGGLLTVFGVLLLLIRRRER